MRVDIIVPDTATPIPPSTTEATSSAGFSGLVDAASAALDTADSAERAFIAHRGGLQEMVVERARAGIMLQIAVAGAQKVTQGLQAVLGMQI